VSGSGVTLRQQVQVFPGLLVTSSILVLVAAVGFDLLAHEPPTHALAVGLVAVIVGIGRLWTLGRFPGVFAAVNAAVVGQPAVHAVSKLTEVAVDVPHSHGWSETVPAITLHVVVALLVVVVAASEPAGRYVASAVLRLVARTRCSPVVPAPARAVSPDHRSEPRAREHELLFTRQARRRGPPTIAPAC
jgi:hypothetical protein